MDNSNIGNVKSNQVVVTGLRKQISHLRFFVYTLVAVLIFFTCLSMFWIYYNYSLVQLPFETFYSQAPQKPVAYLYLSPEKGNYKVGQEFTIDVLINTAGSNVVASAAYLSYDKKKIEALSINITGSVFNMTAEKEINANDGKIKITLGKPTPGIVTFSGNKVRMATITFRALEKTSPTVDNVSFDFTKGSSLYSTVIIDDKKGTNILEATRGSEILIN